MEILLANAAGLRKETLNGREYLVAHLTLIVPGVLNGSMGALYYPEEEIRNNYDAWNGMPMVVYHPVINGKNVSARSPQVLNKSEIGRVFGVNVSAEGKLEAEGWFDVALTKKVDPRVYNALINKQPIELSTGLFTDNYPMKGKCPKGRDYNAIARNYRPDHLAILPDQKGACSLNDGCGVLANGATMKCAKCESKMEANAEGDMCADCKKKVNNSTPVAPMPLTPERRTQIVNQLCTNCACWKGKDDREVLNKFSDEKLESLEKHAAEEAAKDAVVNTVKAQFGELTVNALNEKIVEGKTAVENAKKTPPAPTPTPVVVPVIPTPTENTAMDMKTWLAAMPPEAQATWNNVVEIEQREKNQLIGFLTANIADAATKTLQVNRLATKSLAELKEKVEEVKLFAPPAPAVNRGNTPAPVPMYMGANPPVVNASPPAKKTPLKPPTINWEQEAKQRQLEADATR